MKIIKFSASWCGPCKHLSTTISQLPENKRDLFQEIDVDLAPKELLSEYNIRSVPTMIFMDDKSNPVKIVTGNQSKKRLLELIDELQTNNRC